MGKPRGLSIEYEAYLRSPEWDAKRRAVLKRDGYQCTVCLATDTTLQVHHLMYAATREEETLDYLTTVCKACHDEYHTVQRRRSSKRKYPDKTSQHGQRLRALTARQRRQDDRMRDLMDY